MRKPIKRKNKVVADSVYNSERVARFINYVMLDGKKETARKIVYGAFDIIKEKTGNSNPLEIFDAALKNASPVMEVRSRRIGGANYQVPVEVRPERRNQLGMRWILAGVRNQKGGKTHKVLADELIAASNNEGTAVKKKEDTHRMADANKAFAHFAW
jgi:small subunit ribosomal protein S7